jgi:hypothetical protein
VPRLALRLIVAQAVNEALRDVLSGMWLDWDLDWDPQAERVLGEFKLRTPRSLKRPRLLRPPGPLADEFPAPHTSQLMCQGPGGDVRR